MRMFIWGPAVIIPLITFAISIGLFLGIAIVMNLVYPNALALGTVLFIVISAAAFVLARRTEQAHASSNPDQSGDHH